jgi:hypothetical protein
MRVRGRVEIGPFGGTSKSARAHQAFLLTDDGERLLLRRYDGPSMRDEVLEALAGQTIVADGLLRDRLFIAKSLEPAGDGGATTPASEKPPSIPGGSAKRRR